MRTHLGQAYFCHLRETCMLDRLADCLLHMMFDLKDMWPRSPSIWSLNSILRSHIRLAYHYHHIEEPSSQLEPSWASFAWIRLPNNTYNLIINLIG